MQKRFEDKRWGLTLAFLALISLVLLAGALRTMNFRPGQPIGSSDSDKGSLDLTAIVTLLVDAAEVPFWQQITSWGILFVMVLLISTLLSPELRKKLIRTFLRIASFAIILFMLIKRNPDVLTNLLQNFPTFNDLGAVPLGQDIAPPVFQPPQISTSLIFFNHIGDNSFEHRIVVGCKPLVAETKRTNCAPTFERDSGYCPPVIERP